MIIRSSAGAYPIIFASVGESLAPSQGPRVILTDSNVADAWGASIPREVPVHVVAPGEASKSIAVYQRALEWMARCGATRRTTVIAFGGGVVGDLAGFVAATYMRGVPLVLVPTTLLAMVDSSVGGKTGLDLPQGKNLVGAFHPPKRVSIPLEALATLPERELANGAAEVVKYGFILDASLFDLLGDCPVRPDHPNIESIVRRCIALKAHIVEQDEFETTGLRAILNFGHTVGHAIEAAMGYAEILHGEAVAIGMVLEARLGERLSVTPHGLTAMVRDRLASQRLPLAVPQGLDSGVLIDAMRRDKKATSGGMAFSLLTGLGACKLVPEVGEDDVRAVLEDA